MNISTTRFFMMLICYIKVSLLHTITDYTINVTINSLNSKLCMYSVYIPHINVNL